MLSNSDCPFIRDLFKDFKYSYYLRPRATLTATLRSEAKFTEVLVTSY